MGENKVYKKAKGSNGKSIVNELAYGR